MKAMPDSSDSLVFECDFDEPPEKVWRALIEPQLLESWLATADRERIEARGEAAETPDRVDPGVGRVGSSDYEIVTAEPNHRVRYRWRDRENGVGDSDAREVHSVVTVELTPCPAGGTHLRLTHGEFRIVSTGAVAMTSARVTPITSARRRGTPILCCAVQTPWRRAA